VLVFFPTSRRTLNLAEPIARFNRHIKIPVISKISPVCQPSKNYLSCVKYDGRTIALGIPMGYASFYRRIRYKEFSCLRQN
jgi:hypothetical protein